MICYMPFSYFAEARLRRAVRYFGKLIVYQPGDFLLTESLRRRRAAGEVDARMPSGIDPVRLRNVLQAFKGWAGRVQSRPGDLSSFFRSMAGRFPMMDDGNPSQIGTRIRQYGQPPEEPDSDPFFQAVLFMAMAHEFDAQQDALGRELGSVRTLEKRMFDQLAGRHETSEEIDEAVEALSVERSSPPEEDSGLYMTDQRIQAWAALAAADPEPPGVYVTHSRAVWESLVEMLPEMTRAAQWAMDAEAGLSAERLKTMENLLYSREPLNEPIPGVTAPRLSLNVLTDCNPRRFCDLLSGRDDLPPSAPAAGIPVNTVLGLLEEGR